MRIRKKPYAKSELEVCEFYIKRPEEIKGKWKEIFEKPNPIYLELGCGKGVFASKFGSRNSNINLLAIDLKSEILLKAKRNIEEEYERCKKDINNIYITAQNIERILDIMNEKDVIDRIYINFCNPWPKSRHKKRRLTHTNQLEKYKMFLKTNGEIYFKTDDDELFLESIKYFEQEGFNITYKTFDLHSEYQGDNIITEHEKMFIEKGIKVKFLIAKAKNNSVDINISI